MKTTIDPRYDHASVRSEFTDRSPLRRKVMHNTYLHRESADDTAPIMLRYHSTDIITWHPMPRGDIEINTDGWMTSTTKLRLNEYLAPLRIYQHLRQWFWWLPGSDWNDRVPYTDGDMIEFDKSTSTYELRTCVPVDEALNEQKKRAAQRRRVLKYAKLYKDKMPFDWESRKGDCFECQMYLAHTQITAETGAFTLKPAPIMSKHIGSQLVERRPACGELESGRSKESVADHLITHMEEGCVMASLCYNALTHPRTHCAPAWMWVAFKGPEGQTFPDRDGWLKDRVVKAIAHYLRIQLGLEK